MICKGERKQKSKSPKSNSLDRELKKIRTEQSLRRRVIYGGIGAAQPNPPRLLNKPTDSKDITGSKQSHSPKYQLHVRKHPTMSMALTATEKEVEQIEKELKIEKPKIVKKRGQPYEQLQHRLVNIESLIGQLKETMHKLQRPRKSRSKNSKKSKKSSSMEEHRLREVEEEKKEDDSPPNSAAIRRYTYQVNKFEPHQSKESTTPEREGSTHLNRFSPKGNQQHERQDEPYYVGKLVQSLSSGLPCQVEEHLLQALQAINFMKSIRPPSQEQLDKLKATLPAQPVLKKTVLLDLDETLIHCNEEIQGHVRLPIKLPDGQITKAGVNIRPHARRFLEKVSQKFEIIVFTAGHPCYANVILDLLDPQNKYISQRLFREHCYLTDQGIYIKDLRVIQNRDLKDILLVDNAPYSYYFQMENGVPIVPYYDSHDDCQLLSLQKFLLEKVYPSGDVRNVLRDHFKLHRYPQYSNINHLIEALYLR